MRASLKQNQGDPRKDSEVERGIVVSVSDRGRRKYGPTREMLRG
jgi:hypothetical protein